MAFLFGSPHVKWSVCVLLLLISLSTAEQTFPHNEAKWHFTFSELRIPKMLSVEAVPTVGGEMGYCKEMSSPT